MVKKNHYLQIKENKQLQIEIKIKIISSKINNKNMYKIFKIKIN